MTYAAVMREIGDADVLKFQEISVDRPGPGEALVRQTAIGVNFLDIYFRSGFFKPGQFPFINGFEAAGVIEELGPEVTGLKVGDRVGYQLVVGAYASARIVKTDRLIRLSDTISDVQAAAIMLKGMTAEFLLRRLYQVASSDSVLIHAAAGGVGSLLTQWAKHLGATVIGTVSSKEKMDVARKLGCDYVFSTNEDFVTAVKRDLGEFPVSVFYDGVGQRTFAPSLNLLRTFGWGVLYGWVSGRSGPIDPHALQARSLTVSSPSLGHYTETRDQLQGSADVLFEAVSNGVLESVEPIIYPLKDAGKAHADLEGRKTTGSIVLVP